MKSLGDVSSTHGKKRVNTKMRWLKKLGSPELQSVKPSKALQKVSTVTPFLKLQLHCGVHRSGFRTEMKKISIGKIMLRAAHRETQHTLTL
ncbi:Uncharacterised protein [Escherichia coli]|nr:Uncharacterised protein [Escherichia coli]